VKAWKKQKPRKEKKITVFSPLGERGFKFFFLKNNFSSNIRYDFVRKGLKVIWEKNTDHQYAIKDIRNKKKLRIYIGESIQLQYLKVDKYIICYFFLF
jgi:hypothetical protein